MSFKTQLSADINNIFLNINEFAENVTYTDFEEILITRDGRSWQAHDLAEHAWQVTWAQDKRTGKSWAAAV